MPPLKPRRLAKRQFQPGTIVRVQRPRDWKVKTVAYVESLDADRGVVRVLLPSGETADIDAAWCLDASAAAASAARLPTDVLTKIAAFLSAKRTARAAQACSRWRPCFGVAEAGEHWRARLVRRWPPPVHAALPADANWLDAFRAKLDAECTARAAARRSLVFGFGIRVCAWPLCSHVLDDRAKALTHHATHFGCWGPMIHADVEWLNTQVSHLQGRTSRIENTFTDREQRIRALLELRDSLRNCKSLARYFKTQLKARLNAKLRGRRPDQAQPSLTN